MQRAGSSKFIVGILLAGILVSGLAASVPAFAQEATPEPEASPGAAASPSATTPYQPAEFVSGMWRIAVITAEWANDFPEFELESRPDKDWVVVIADITNWSRNDERLDPADFDLQVRGQDEPRGFARRSTERTADALDLEPEVVSEGVEIDAADTERVTLVFEAPIEPVDPRLYIEGDSLPLTPAIEEGPPLDDLPEQVTPGDTVRQSVQAITDGRTIELGANNTPAQLSFVEVPVEGECFSSQSESRLRRITTERVIVEIENEAAYYWTEEDDGTRRLLNYEQVSGGYGGITPGLEGRFALWMSTGDQAAKSDGGGLWSACTGLHGVPRTSEPERSNIRMSDGEGGTTSYRVWLEWAPELVTTPDGGAWAFFSALADNGAYLDKQMLYASRFDPAQGRWLDATVMPLGEVQFGATAVVDSQGLVHVIYSARETEAEEAWSTLLYTKEDGRGGWITPEPVSLDGAAGHQLSPSLAIDAEDRLYVAWQDQRVFDGATRDSSPLNADILVSSRSVTGEWSRPVLINNHFPTEAALLPKLVVDGERLVAIWSVYTSATGPSNAARMEWATRTIGSADIEWSAPMMFANGRGDSFGGRFVDVAADPTGGVVATYARRGVETYLFVRRLLPESQQWTSDTVVAFGDRGSFPTIAVNNDGVVYVGYNADTGTFGEGESAGVIVDIGVSAIDFRSILPGPEVVVTRDDPNSQGRPVLAIDVTGKPWFVFFGEIPGFPATQVGALRNANIPVAPL